MLQELDIGIPENKDTLKENNDHIEGNSKSTDRGWSGRDDVSPSSLADAHTAMPTCSYTKTNLDGRQNKDRDILARWSQMPNSAAKKLKQSSGTPESAEPAYGIMQDSHPRDIPVGDRNERGLQSIPHCSQESNPGQASNQCFLYNLHPNVRDLWGKIELYWDLSLITQGPVELSLNMDSTLLPATEVMKSQIDDFENYMIQSLLESRNNASIIMLKRFHTDIIVRGITFKGIPGLRVIISQLIEPPTSVRQVSYPFGVIAQTMPTARSRYRSRSRSRGKLLRVSGQALGQSLPTPPRDSFLHREGRAMPQAQMQQARAMKRAQVGHQVVPHQSETLNSNASIPVSNVAQFSARSSFEFSENIPSEEVLPNSVKQLLENYTTLYGAGSQDHQ